MENRQEGEKLSGIVERVTYHNEQNGWSVLKVNAFRGGTSLVTVLVHQAKVFAGATMDFWGNWSHHPKHGEQFKAIRSMEKKPASVAAMEKYLGSGMITGVGPKTAKRIVAHFKDQTLNIFENTIDELMSVPGIAEKKLLKIKESWDLHKGIRDVMIFLQGYGISTLFATKIYKTYGDKSISLVSENPYRLAHDIYGIGFFSADKIALSMGFERDGSLRMEAGIKHVLASSRDEGHCFLTQDQIVEKTLHLLEEKRGEEKVVSVLDELLSTHQVKLRQLKENNCFYSKGLYYDELHVAEKIRQLISQTFSFDGHRVESWMTRYCQKHEIELSDEQRNAVVQIPGQAFSILTGGPGCGKTTCTKVLVELLKAMRKRVVLAAPTGRAAQRMSEVIGLESKTIHRLLEWEPGKARFKANEENPLELDFLILDEVSMLDISLASHLLKAVPTAAQLLFIGDPDQLPAVGAGHVLSDLLQTKVVPRFCLTKVFRQAQKSSIIRFAHEINLGRIPKIISPVKEPEVFLQGSDCLFMDAEEATREQVRFIQRVQKRAPSEWEQKGEESIYFEGDEKTSDPREPLFVIPEKFKHVDIAQLLKAETEARQLKSLLKTVHPWSTLRYGLTALETVKRLYTKTLPQWLGQGAEIQVLSPQVRGSLGTFNINKVLQEVSNPESPHKKQLAIGEKILRQGDRVIQTKNNYNLGIFNGDIGKIVDVDTLHFSCTVEFSAGSLRSVVFQKSDLSELQLAYGITIHKSQGSEFGAVIIPLLGQHYNMLFRNLIYTGLTRAKHLAVFVGSRKALSMAVKQVNPSQRQTALTSLVEKVAFF